MEKHEKLICDFIYEFVDKNWIYINLEKCQIKDSKEDYLTKVKNDVEEALWVITEVACWGMKDRKIWLKEIYAETEGCDFNVLKIKGKYIKIKFNGIVYDTCFVNPKKKTVIYFD